MIDEVRSKAQQWGLQADDWLRFEELMQGPRGLYSPGLDPLTVLGIEARTDEERRYYAELQVQAEARRVEKELAYQLAYDEAWKRLNPTLQPVNALDSQPVISGDGRLAIFVRENCPSCDQEIKQLQARRQSFDVYLVDSLNDDAAVRRWATRVGVDTNRVAQARSRSIMTVDGGGSLAWATICPLLCATLAADGYDNEKYFHLHAG